MKSFLDVESGIYDPRKRFAFTNITEEPLVSAYDGQSITIQPHQTVELKHHLAIKLTGELVDKIMIGNVKMDEVQKNQPYYRSPQGSSLGVPSARKVWEDQILVELSAEDNSAQSEIDKAVIKEELKRDLSAETSTSPAVGPTSTAEFADALAKPEVKIKAPLKVKPIKAKK